MNNKKEAFLGIPFGTAMARLRKMIMLDLLVQLGKNVCYVCGEEIIAPNDLSIEHMKPWEGRSVELFWDLNNIAFSHLRCNVPHIRGGGSIVKKLGPNNTAWCPRCNGYIDKDLFFVNKSNASQLSGFCKKHHHEHRMRKR